MEKVNSDTILEYMKTLVESKIPIPREDWINAAFRLEMLRLDEAKMLNRMAQDVAKLKKGVVSEQVKKNVSAAEVEVESSDAYLFFKDQEAKLFTVDEFVRLAKKLGDVNL